MATRITGRQLIIDEVVVDPVSPLLNQMWVLKTSYIGQPIGLLLSLTQASLMTYQLSYKTTEGTIIRQSLG